MSSSDDHAPRDHAPLDPLLLNLAAARQLRPTYAAIGVAEARRNFLASQAAGDPAPALAAIENDEDAARQASDRVYYPMARPGTRLIVYFHGGGFVFGNLDSHDRNIRRLAAASGAVVVSVDYRLAPEFPFPAGMEDALFALRFITSASTSFVRTPPQIFVGGDSAGATLAIAAILAVAAEGGLPFAGLLACYPMVDLSGVGRTGSYAAFGDGRAGLSLADAEWFRDRYTPDPTARTDWRCSPLHAENLALLPPTLVVAAAHDIPRDEGAEFANRLRMLGVPVTYHLADDMNHGFMGTADTLPAILKTLDVVNQWLQIPGRPDHSPHLFLYDPTPRASPITRAWWRKTLPQPTEVRRARMPGPESDRATTAEATRPSQASRRRSSRAVLNDMIFGGSSYSAAVTASRTPSSKNDLGLKDLR